MTEQGTEGAKEDADDGVLELRPLFFEQVSDDGETAVFRALVNDGERSPDRGGAGDSGVTPLSAVPGGSRFTTVVAPGGSGVPVYSVTVTITSPKGNAQATAGLNQFLSEFRADILLTAPFPDVGPEDEEPPLKLDSEILFELDVLDPKGVHGTFGVEAVMEGTADEEAPVMGQTPQPLPPGAVVSVSAHKEHRWTARGGIKKATVTQLQGNGSIRRPPRTIAADSPTQSVRASTVWVHGGKSRLRYRFVGRFNLVR
jgi:hypothetical protein